MAALFVNAFHSKICRIETNANTYKKKAHNNESDKENVSNVQLWNLILHSVDKNVLLLPLKEGHLESICNLKETYLQVQCSLVILSTLSVYG